MQIITSEDIQSLYELCPYIQNCKVFECAPENHRFCVISTSVSETSLKIHCGYGQNEGLGCMIKHGGPSMDKVTGVSTYHA